MADLTLARPHRRTLRPGRAGTTLATLMLAGAVLAGLAAPLLWPLDQSAIALDAIAQPPSSAQPGGTHDHGRDVLHPSH
jgi:peptide/nickel transport system permease protein